MEQEILSQINTLSDFIKLKQANENGNSGYKVSQVVTPSQVERQQQKLDSSKLQDLKSQQNLNPSSQKQDSNTGTKIQVIRQDPRRMANVQRKEQSNKLQAAQIKIQAQRLQNKKYGELQASRMQALPDNMSSGLQKQSSQTKYQAAMLQQRQNKEAKLLQSQITRQGSNKSSRRQQKDQSFYQRNPSTCPQAKQVLQRKSSSTSNYQAQIERHNQYTELVKKKSKQLIMAKIPSFGLSGEESENSRIQAVRSVDKLSSKFSSPKYSSETTQEDSDRQHIQKSSNRSSNNNSNHNSQYRSNNKPSDSVISRNIQKSNDNKANSSSNNNNNNTISRRQVRDSLTSLNSEKDFRCNSVSTRQKTEEQRLKAIQTQLDYSREVKSTFNKNELFSTVPLEPRCQSQNSQRVLSSASARRLYVIKDDKFQGDSIFQKPRDLFSGSRLGDQDASESSFQNSFNDSASVKSDHTCASFQTAQNQAIQSNSYLDRSTQESVKDQEKSLQLQKQKKLEEQQKQNLMNVKQQQKNRQMQQLKQMQHDYNENRQKNKAPLSKVTELVEEQDAQTTLGSGSYLSTAVKKPQTQPKSPQTKMIKKILNRLACVISKKQVNDGERITQQPKAALPQCRKPITKQSPTKQFPQKTAAAQQLPKKADLRRRSLSELSEDFVDYEGQNNFQVSGIFQSMRFGAEESLFEKKQSSKLRQLKNAFHFDSIDLKSIMSQKKQANSASQNHENNTKEEDQQKDPILESQYVDFRIKQMKKQLSDLQRNQRSTQSAIDPEADQSNQFTEPTFSQSQQSTYSHKERPVANHTQYPVSSQRPQGNGAMLYNSVDLVDRWGQSQKHQAGCLNSCEQPFDSNGKVVHIQFLNNSREGGPIITQHRAYKPESSQQGTRQDHILQNVLSDARSKKALREQLLNSNSSQSSITQFSELPQTPRFAEEQIVQEPVNRDVFDFYKQEKLKLDDLDYDADSLDDRNQFI